jgi:GxxExxY protein
VSFVVDAFFLVVVTSDLAVAGLIEDHCWMARRSIRRISANEVSHLVITATMRVHTELGPGLLESTYTACLQHQLSEAGVRSCCPGGVAGLDHGGRLELGYRMDLVVEELVIAEIKSVEAVSPVHQAQLLSYLKLSGKSIGLLINFNVVHLKDGIRRFVNRTVGSSLKNKSINHKGRGGTQTVFVPNFPLCTFVSVVVKRG